MSPQFYAMFTYPAYGVPATILLLINTSLHLTFCQLYPHTVIPALLFTNGFDYKRVITTPSIIFEITEYLTVILLA